MKAYAPAMFLTIVCFLLASCGSSTPDPNAVQTAIAQTQEAQPTNTPIPPTSTPEPTATPTEIPPTPGQTLGSEHYAWNYIATQESGGITIQIARLVIADKATVPQDFTAGGRISTYDDCDVVAEIVFIVTNNTNQVINIYPDQATVVAGSEQIDLQDFRVGRFGDDVSGEIYPNVTVIGGVWFGFKRTTVPEIQQMMIVINGPHDANFNSLGEDITFTLDLSQRQNEPLPDELR